MDLLFRDVTVVNMDAPVLKNVDVGVLGRKICYLAKTGHGPEAVRVIDCKHKVLMPGLYNTHTHGAMTLFRGFAGDLSLEDWLFNNIFPAEAKLTPELIRVGTSLAVAEMIASGTIAFTDMYISMDAVAEVADSAGVLANVSNAVIDFSKEGYVFKNDKIFAQTEKVLSNSTDGRIKADVSIHGVYTSLPYIWEQVMDYTLEKNLNMHVHLSETKTEHENCIKQFGLTPTQVFDKYGVFDVPSTAAHCVWVTDEDIEILKKKNVTVAHNPLSNLKLASGLAPVAKMLEKGLNVSIGTDGMSSNNSHDMFEELKMASLLQKYATGDPTTLPALQALKMATVNGAKAQGRSHESGQIKEGFDADIILIDQNNPRQTMCYCPISNLAYSSSGRDVEMTVCRGKVLYEKGEFKTIDIEKTLHDARKAKEIFLS